jgi:hypothetical protein
VPGTQSIRTGLCVGQAGRDPENLRSFRDRRNDEGAEKRLPAGEGSRKMKP